MTTTVKTVSGGVAAARAEIEKMIAATQSERDIVLRREKSIARTSEAAFLAGKVVAYRDALAYLHQ